MTPRVTNAVLAVKMDSMDKNINKRIDYLASTVEKHDKLLFGDEKAIGMKSEVRSNSNDLQTIKRLSWAILFIFVAEFLARLFNIM